MMSVFWGPMARPRGLYDNTMYRAVQLPYGAGRGVVEEQQAIPLFLLILREEGIGHFVMLLRYLRALYALQAIETLHAVRTDIAGHQLFDHVQVLTLNGQVRLERIHACGLIYQLLTQAGAIARQDVTDRRIDDEHRQQYDQRQNGQRDHTDGA